MTDPTDSLSEETIVLSDDSYDCEVEELDASEVQKLCEEELQLLMDDLGISHAPGHLHSVCTHLFQLKVTASLPSTAAAQELMATELEMPAGMAKQLLVSLVDWSWTAEHITHFAAFTNEIFNCKNLSKEVADALAIALVADWPKRGLRLVNIYRAAHY